MKQFYFSALLLVSTLAWSQTQTDSIATMDELVIQENRFSTPVSKQNRNVYVIDKSEIEKLPARTLNEILQYANGIDIRQRGPFGSQADISIDGGSFEQTVVLVNGAKIIDSQTAHNMLNLPIPAEIIERIEIIRGPVARIYGINSLTGAINIITKKPTDSGILISTFAGSNFEKDVDDTNDTFYGTGIQLGGVVSKEKHQHSVFVSHDKSNGYRYNTGFENNKLFYQGNAQFNSNNEISGSFGYVKNGFGANGFYAAPGDINSHEVVQTTFAALQSKHKLSDKWALTPRVSYRYNFDDYRYLGNTTAARSLHYTNSVAAEVNTTYKTGTGEFGFGAEARNEDINSTSIGDHNRNNFGIYAEYRTTFFEKLSINIGSYLNYNSDYKWQAYPGIDAGYAISNTFKIIGNVGTSQRIPSFTDLYLDQRPGNIGNSTLDSENAYQGELGFKYFKNNFTLTSNYFYRNISNFIDWTRDVNTEPWQSQNFGDLITNGISARGTYTVNILQDSRLNVMLGYTYLDSEFKNVTPGVNSKYLISSLKHQVTNTVSYQYKKFSVLFATRFNERATGGSYWINDFRVNQHFSNFTVFLDAQNIFKTTYFEAGAIPLPARWISAGVKFASF